MAISMDAPELVRLKACHAALESALQTLDALTRKAVPDRGQLASARLALSQASSSRTRCLNNDVYPAVLAIGDRAAQESVRALQSDGARLRAHSTEHVAAWSIDRAMNDWDGYRRASADMRAAMRGRVTRERALLYPVLSAERASAA